MAEKPNLRAEVRALAAELRKKVYGASGVPAWGTKFSEIEELACEIGDALTCEIVQQAVADQALAVPTEAAVCGTCGQPTLTDPDDSVDPHPLEISRGDVGWNQPKQYCPACRRAFFPSVPSTRLAAR